MIKAKMTSAFFPSVSIYLVGAILIGVRDFAAMILYIVLLPFHVYLLKKAWNGGSVAFLTLFCLLLFAQGINPTFFFLNRNYYNTSPYTAIGSFDFSLYSFFSAYSYVFAFSIAVYLIFFIFQRSKLRRYGFSFIKNTLKTFQGRYRKINSSVIFDSITLFVAIFGIWLSIWMYHNKIGILGLHQTQLPFHLTGVLYYFRLLIIPAFLVFCYVFSSHKRYTVFLLMAYSVVAGFSSASKTTVTFVMLPVCFESILDGKRLRATISILFYSLMYIMVTEERALVYLSENTDLLSAIMFATDAFLHREQQWLFEFIHMFTGRLYGGSIDVLMVQYDDVSFSSLVRFYAGDSFLSLFPNIYEKLFGFVSVPGRNYGISEGFIGQMIVLSSHSQLRSALQGFWIGLILLIQDRCVIRIMRKQSGKLLPLFSSVVSVASVGMLWVTVQIKIIYLLTFLLFIVSIFCSRKQYQQRTEIESDHVVA